MRFSQSSQNTNRKCCRLFASCLVGRFVNTECSDTQLMMNNKIIISCGRMEFFSKKSSRICVHAATSYPCSKSDGSFVESRGDCVATKNQTINRLSIYFAVITFVTNVCFNHFSVILLPGIITTIDDAHICTGYAMHSCGKLNGLRWNRNRTNVQDRANKKCAGENCAWLQD